MLEYHGQPFRRAKRDVPAVLVRLRNVYVLHTGCGQSEQHESAECEGPAHNERQTRLFCQRHTLQATDHGLPTEKYKA